MDVLRVAGTRKVAAISMFTALAVATDYAMLPLANVKLMDSIVFVSALAFGLEVGEINPLGPDGGVLLLVLVGSETIYAFLGCLVRRSLDQDQVGFPTRSLLWGSLGLIGAFVYDLITNVAPGLLAGMSPGQAVFLLVPGAPFMVAHEVSDFVFFAIVAPLLYGAIRVVLRRQMGVVTGRPHLLDSKP